MNKKVMIDFLNDLEMDDYVIDADDIYINDNGVKCYDWVIEGNLKTFEIEEGYSTVTELVLSDCFLDLDKWDRRNIITDGVGLHQRVYEVIEKNGEKVDNMYLLYKWSQCQESQPKGELLSLSDLIEYFKTIYHDVDE